MPKKPQVHKRIVLLFMKDVFESYLNDRLTLAQSIEALGLGRSNFFRYLKMYRQNPTGFDIKYKRNTPNRETSADVDQKISDLLRQEKELIKDPGCEAYRYNFQAIADEFKRKEGINISAQTIRRKAIEWNLYLPRKKQTKIYRQLEITKIGRLFQHYTCIHQWSP